ncbi:MAG: hypothetical protein M3135_01765, partial [Actinomycetota bacterium]|nr:hypothetical protein [Actinomycetota bacterium]
VLAVVCGVVMARGAQMGPLAMAAAAVMFVGGLSSIAAARPSSSVAALTGTAFGLPFVALGLGGAVGVRAFLILLPVLLLASGIAVILAPRDPGPDGVSPARRRRSAEAQPDGEPPPAPVPQRPVGAVWTGLATASLGVALGSMLGAPPGGAFPGTWLVISLALIRAEEGAAWLLVAAGAAIGLAMALSSIGGLVRSARPRPVPVAASAVGALALLYAGVQPVRLAIGWWIRVESSLGVAEVLPASGAPSVPPVGGLNLLLAAAPALAIAAVICLRGLRDPERAWVRFGGPRRTSPPAGRLRSWVGRVARPLAPVGASIEPLRRVGVGFAIAAAFEVAALLVAGRLVLLTAERGFL